MEKIYEHYEDVHVKATMIYVKDGVAYQDSECKVAFTTEPLKNVFFKSGVVNVDGTLYKPTSFAIGEDNLGEITYVTAGSTATVKAAPMPTDV